MVEKKLDGERRTIGVGKASSHKINGYLAHKYFVGLLYELYVPYAAQNEVGDI